MSPHFSKLYEKAIISGPGIICGPLWGSFAVRGSFAGRDHLRACSSFYNVLCKILSIRFRLYMAKEPNSRLSVSEQMIGLLVMNFNACFLLIINVEIEL